MLIIECSENYPILANLVSLSKTFVPQNVQFYVNTFIFLQNAFQIYMDSVHDFILRQHCHYSQKLAIQLKLVRNSQIPIPIPQRHLTSASVRKLLPEKSRVWNSFFTFYNWTQAEIDDRPFGKLPPSSKLFTCRNVCLQPRLVFDYKVFSR